MELVSGILLKLLVLHEDATATAQWQSYFISGGSTVLRANGTQHTGRHRGGVTPGCPSSERERVMARGNEPIVHRQETQQPGEDGCVGRADCGSLPPILHVPTSKCRTLRSRRLDSQAALRVFEVCRGRRAFPIASEHRTMWDALEEHCMAEPPGDQSVWLRPYQAKWRHPSWGYKGSTSRENRPWG